MSDQDPEPDVLRSEPMPDMDPWFRELERYGPPTGTPRPLGRGLEPGVYTDPEPDDGVQFADEQGDEDPEMFECGETPHAPAAVGRPGA